MPYHTKGISKNKKIRENRKKHLPINLMGYKIEYKKDCMEGIIYLVNKGLMKHDKID